MLFLETISGMVHVLALYRPTGIAVLPGDALVATVYLLRYTLCVLFGFSLLPEKLVFPLLDSSFVIKEFRKGLAKMFDDNFTRVCD